MRTTVAVPAVMVRSRVMGRAAVAAVSVAWRVMPRVVMLMRRLRVPVPRRVMPRVVMLMRPLRVPVPRWVMPRVMVVRVDPVVIVMAPRGQMGMDAAVVEPPPLPLAHVVPRGWLRRLRGRVAAGTTSIKRRTGTATRLP